MNTSISVFLALSIACYFGAASSFMTSSRQISDAQPSAAGSRSRGSDLFAGGWGNNQERPVLNEEFGGVNGSPIYDSYAIENRGQFMQRVNDERKSLRIKKAADLLEVARIAGVELKRKERDPEKLDLFDSEDLKSDEEYLDVSI
jgi:hypothetical protein